MIELQQVRRLIWKVLGVKWRRWRRFEYQFGWDASIHIMRKWDHPVS